MTADASAAEINASKMLTNVRRINVIDGKWTPQNSTRYGLVEDTPSFMAGSLFDRCYIGFAPEPAVWLQFILGFGLIGALTRVRNARARSLTPA